MVLFVLLLLGASASPQDAPLLEAARDGNLARIEALLSEGSPVDSRNRSGEPALLLATRGGFTDVVRRLLSAHANPNLATHTGLTPLIEAAARGRLEVARILIDANASTEARDRGLGTPLDAARLSGEKEIVALLLGRGGRGSGKSLGDTVCVEPWGVGKGFCGVVREASGVDFTLGVSRVNGCTEGCRPNPDCSEGRWVGGGGSESLEVGRLVRVKSWCLTRTGASPSP